MSSSSLPNQVPPHQSLTIWICNHYALPTSEAGGSRHFALARELIARGHRVYLIAACRNYQSPENSRLPRGVSSRLETVDGVPFLWLKTPAYRTNGVGRFLNMLAYAARLALPGALRTLPEPDVVIGSSPHPFAALAALRVARARRVPFLLEIRDLWPQSLIDVAGVSARHPFVILLRAIEKFLYRRADAVISLLPGAAAYIRGVAKRPVDVHWVPNGVDVSMVPWPNGTPSPAAFTVVYAGAHGEANGLDVVLDAAALIEARGLGSKIRFRLIGNGPEKGRLQERAAALGLQSLVFQNPVPKAEIYGCLAEANVCLMLLKDSPVFRWGVSPNKLFDYLASGRPVVFGVSTEFNPVAAANAGITIPPGDPGALADAIITLAESSADARASMGERGRAYVLENHGFERLAARVESASRKVIDAQKEPRRVRAYTTALE